MADLYVVRVSGKAYDGRPFVCVAQSMDAALTYIKENFPHKHDRVTWGEVQEQGDENRKWHVIEAEFEAVPAYTIEHTATFTIEPQQIV